MTLKRHLWDRARINRGGQGFFVFCLSVWLFSPPVSIQWLQKQSYLNWCKMWPLQHTEEIPHLLFTDTIQFLMWTYISCTYFKPQLSITHITSDQESLHCWGCSTRRPIAFMVSVNCRWTMEWSPLIRQTSVAPQPSDQLERSGLQSSGTLRAANEKKESREESSSAQSE